MGVSVSALAALFFAALGETEGTTLVFIHYHKTGNQLTPQLKEGIQKYKRLGLSNNAARLGGKRICPCGALPCEEQGGSTIWNAPEMSLRPSPMPPCYAFLHMVRDPAKWAVSFYDYHRAGHEENAWVDYVPNCTAGLPTHASALELSAPLLDATVAACAALVTPGHNFFRHLRDLPEEDGLRLVALLMILGGTKPGHDSHLPTGELGRSAANLRKMQETPQARVLNMLMDDFITRPAVAMSEVSDFVTNLTMGDRGERARVQASLANQMAQRQTAVLRKPTNHMTFQRRSHEQKEALLLHLDSDPVLAPTYRVWRRLFGLVA